jgi:hypothetical protein
MPDNSRLAPTDRRGPTLRRGTRDTGMGAGMTKSVSYFGTHAGKSPVKAVASAAMAFTLVNPLFRITSDPTQIVQIDYRLRSDCLEHLKCRLWI